MEKNKITKAVMRKIEKGDIKRKPYWLCFLESWSGYFGVLLLVILLIFIFSTWVYLVTDMGLYEGENWRNLIIYHTPWQTIILFLIILGALIYLLRHVSIYYRYQKRILLSVIIIVTLILSGIIFYTDLHHRAHLTVGFLGRFYEREGNFWDWDKDIDMIGQVEQYQANQLQLKDRQNHLVNIDITQNTNFKESKIYVGDYVRVIGRKSGDTIIASYIRELDLCPGVVDPLGACQH